MLIFLTNSFSTASTVLTIIGALVVEDLATLAFDDDILFPLQLLLCLHLRLL